MRMMRAPSSVSFLSGNDTRLATCNSAEHGTDGHPKTGEISFAQNVPRHDLTRGEDVLRNVSLLIHPQSEIRERNAWSQGIRNVRRRVDLLRPVGFRNGESVRAASIEFRVIEVARLHSIIEL